MTTGHGPDAGQLLLAFHVGRPAATDELVGRAVRAGEVAVRGDPRYPPPGDERATFWRRVHEALLADPGPCRCSACSTVTT